MSDCVTKTSICEDLKTLFHLAFSRIRGGLHSERLNSFCVALERAYLVDLCPSLLEIAQSRLSAQGWKNVQPVLADVTEFGGVQANVVTFSYSLTMIPNWFDAIENAWKLLKPGGTIGVVDFYVSRKYPAEGHCRHNWSTRTFWPLWFGSDNVALSPDHLPCLQSRFETVEIQEQRGKVPYLPLVRVPYYLFIGRKPRCD